MRRWTKGVSKSGGELSEGEFTLTDWNLDGDRSLGDLPVKGGHSFRRNVLMASTSPSAWE